MNRMIAHPSRKIVFCALCAWAAFTGIVWTLFVPKGLSVGTWTMLTLTGPILLVGVATSRRFRQLRAETPGPRQAQ